MIFRANNGTLTPETATARAWVDKRHGQAVDLDPVSRTRRRSMDANNKYFAWCAQVDRELGWEPGEAHRYCKWHYGLAILTEHHPEYRDRLMALLRPLPNEERLAAMDLITCTSLFSVAEFTTYMDAMQRHFAAEGVVLE